MKNQSFYSMAKTEAGHTSSKAFNLYLRTTPKNGTILHKPKPKLKKQIPLPFHHHLSTHQSSIGFVFSQAERFHNQTGASHLDIV